MREERVRKMELVKLIRAEEWNEARKGHERGRERGEGKEDTNTYK